MKRIFLFLLVSLFWGRLKSQDFLSVPASNPKLFHLNDQFYSTEKIEVREDTFIYNYDTLELPFIDDFSRDHFPRRIQSSSDPSLIKDTTVYRIIIAGVPYRDTIGFTEDSTFVFEVDGNDSITSRIANPSFSIQLVEISELPTTSSNRIVFPAYNIYDTLNGVRDTIPTTVDFKSDSLTYYFVAANSNDFYIDRSAYRNTTFGIEPPSIGVVTFDGLDEFGMPYDIVNNLTVEADHLTSVPINLSNLPDENVFFSFFFQPRGLGLDDPDTEDSLLLDFYNPRTKRWGTIWDTTGFESDTFIQQIIRVPNDFHQNGFQFRFRNYANSTGAFDQWHIDYLYLNNGRSFGDTIYNDIAYVYDAPSLLKDFEAMPWFHFVTDPAKYMIDTAKTTVFNNASEERPVYNKVVIPDTVNQTIYYQDPTDLTRFVRFPPRFLFEFKNAIDFTYPMTDIKGEGTFEATYDIDMRPGPLEEKDFIRENDTIIGKTVLKNYYAYDDGSAEVGYGVNAQIGPDGLTSFMAVEFEIPIEDTLGGIDLYFIPKEFDVRTQSFELMVWNTLDPNGVTFRKAIKSKPVYSDDNAFVTYFFDSLVKVNQNFFVGLRSIGLRSLNVGYDLNTNHKDKISWSQDGVVWSKPSSNIADGSLMLRPIFRKKAFGVGVEERGLRQKRDVTLYPNPTNGILNIAKDVEHKIKSFIISDLSGRTVHEGYYNSQLDVSHLTEGLYFLQLIEEEGTVLTKKFLIAD